MLFTVLGLLFTLVAVVCFALVLLHAFHRSLGTGIMVLFIPFYVLVYGFTQFEHRLKGLVLAGMMGGGLLGVVFRSLGVIAAGQGKL